MRIKLSKSDWEDIGIQSGWLKTAQNHPLKDDPVFGRIVDHNARAESASKDEAKRMIELAENIIEQAIPAGFQGLRIDNKGRIIKSSLVRDWVGRGDSTNTEVIKAWTRPFSSENGKHYWSRTSSNAPEGMSEYHGDRPYEGRIYPPDYKGLRGEDAYDDQDPSGTARQMGM